MDNNKSQVDELITQFINLINKNDLYNEYEIMLCNVITLSKLLEIKLNS